MKTYSTYPKVRDEVMDFLFLRGLLEYRLNEIKKIEKKHPYLKCSHSEDYKVRINRLLAYADRKIEEEALS